MDHVNVDRDFFSILKQTESTLASQVEEVRERGLEDWVHLLAPEFGSHAGYPHLRNVERIANQIVPDPVKDNFSTGEIFLLLSAIFLHDIGKTIPARDDPDQGCDRLRGVCLCVAEQDGTREIGECCRQLRRAE